MLSGLGGGASVLSIGPCCRLTGFRVYALGYGNPGISGERTAFERTLNPP